MDGRHRLSKRGHPKHTCTNDDGNNVFHDQGSPQKSGARWLDARALDEGGTAIPDLMNCNGNGDPDGNDCDRQGLRRSVDDRSHSILDSSSTLRAAFSRIASTQRLSSAVMES